MVAWTRAELVEMMRVLAVGKEGKGVAGRWNSKC